MNSHVWVEEKYKGFHAIKGENPYISVCIIPERGSKLVSLYDKESNKEWIYQNDRKWDPLHYGMNWSEGDRSGWDEMFPTINPSPSPNAPWEHVQFPDHGEVWSLPWKYEIENDRLHLWVYGVQVPYLLKKIYQIVDKELRIEYSLENLTPFPFSYLWAAHPLLHVNQHMELVTESHLKEIQLTYSQEDRLGEMHAQATFPIALSKENKNIDLSKMEPLSSNSAEKYYFVGTPLTGIIGVKDTISQGSITFQFSPDEIPYLAIWANYGGYEGDYNLAIEPATGYLDHLYTADALQKVKSVEGYGINNWNLTVSLST